ncbi:1-phosphofructokinase family hexose kinase [Rhodoferax sp. GW822-FHT02A01]|uniref:1-phosphofructokinase family hexose kinase n=1 Tax=Rhodoferax sp. GW822-FHT02A01 TaxID=3141537 RepID=UPI00315C9989
MTNILTITMNPALDVSTAVDEVRHTSKLRCEPMQRRAGGGGVNVARELHKLGAGVLAFYTAGHSMGRVMLSLLQHEGVSCHPFAISASSRESFTVLEHSTGHEYRFVLPGPELTTQEWEQALVDIEKLCSPQSLVVASGSLPPGVPVDFYARVSEVVQRAHAALVVDTSGEPLRAALAHGVYMVKPSLHELRDLCDKPLSRLYEVRDMAKDMVQHGAAQIMVVSMGEMGALMVTQQGNWYAPPLQVEVHSAVGAGDSFVAGMVWGLSQQQSPVQAFAKGVACATATLMSTASGLGDAAQVLQLLEQVHCFDQFPDQVLPI